MRTLLKRVAIPAEVLPAVPPRDKLADWAREFGLDMSEHQGHLAHLVEELAMRGLSPTGRIPSRLAMQGPRPDWFMVDDPIKDLLLPMQRKALEESRKWFAEIIALRRGSP